MSDHSQRLSTLFDTTSAQEMTKCLGQLCNQLSLSSIKVSRFDTFQDVFEFLNDFEVNTIGLDDEQKLILLNKVFPPGCNRSWFETDLMPKSMSTWTAVREAIVKRFSDSEEKDRHFARIRELKYDPEGSKKLLSFIEDLMYSLTRAFGTLDKALVVKYVKALIPADTWSLLNTHSKFHDATDVNDIKQAAKQYDLTRGSAQRSNPSREATKELATMIQEAVKTIQKDNDATRKVVVAAFRTQSDSQTRGHEQDNYRPGSPYQGRRNQEYRPASSNERRPISPFNDRYNRVTSPARDSSRYDRSRSPQRFRRDGSNDRVRSPIDRDLQGPSLSDRNENRSVGTVADRPPTPGASRERGASDEEGAEALNSKMYFARFKKPPNPCNQCHAWHWRDHCPFRLN